MELNDHKLDLDAMRDGVRVPLNDDGSSGVVVRRIGNPEFRAKLNKLLEPHLETERASGLGEALQTEITGRAMAGTILVGWWGWTEDGEPYEYSEEAAERVMTDPALREVQDAVAMHAGAREKFLAKRDEASSGN